MISHQLVLQGDGSGDRLDHAIVLGSCAVYWGYSFSVRAELLWRKDDRLESD